MRAPFKNSMAGKPSTLLWAIGLIGLVIDQASKYWVLHLFQDMPNPIVAILPFLDITVVWNTGVSYGLLPAGSPFATLALIAMGVIITGFMGWLLWFETAPAARLSYMLIISGAIGNIIDRVIHGAVIDFISPHAWGYHWYVFNVADIWISCGAAGLIFTDFFTQKKNTNTHPPSDGDGSH
jgi:signal peptidase II